ncbi:MAG TPA: hypothetical protein VFE47_26525 [Tepidisphaeraceae bacterium]|nr:hypothetical protein [Tepidisphaeraceae bacterium]
MALIDFSKGPGAAIFESPDYMCWRPAQRAKSTNIITDDSDFPPAMLAAEKPGPSHLLVRKGNSGRYTYIGVGYLDDGVQNGAARVRIVPPVEKEMFDAIGGYGGWEIRIEDPAGRGRTQRIKRASDIRALVKDLGPEFSGTVIARRWATGEMKIIADGKRAAVSYRGSESADPRIKYWVPTPRTSPNPSSSPAGKARNNPPGHPSENRVIVKKALKAMQMFVLGDGDLPVPSHWITTEQAPAKPPDDAKASKALRAAMRRYRVRTWQDSFVRIQDVAAPIMKPVGVLPHDSRVTAMGTSTAGGLHTTDGAGIWIWVPWDRQLVSSEPMFAIWDLAVGHGESDFPLILASWQKIYIARTTPDFEWPQELVCSSDTFGKVQKLEISSNDRLLIANSRDREVAVWDMRTAQELYYFRSESGPIMAIGFSTTKSPLIAYLDEQELVVRNLARDDEIMRAKTIASFADEDDETPSAGVFIRDGQQLAVAVDEVEIWDVDRGQKIRSIPCPHGKVASLAIEPHTQRLLAIAPHAGPVMVVDLIKAKVLHTLGGKNESLTPVHFGRDGDYLYAAADEGVRIWNVADLWWK